MNVDVGVFVGETIVTRHGRDRRPHPVVEVDGRLRSRCGRDRLATRSGMSCINKRLDIRIQRLAIIAGLEFLLLWQFAPRKLLIERITLHHDAPVVDRTGRTRLDAIHAEIAFCHVDHVVVVVVRDCIGRAGLFAGVTANADFRVDEMLLDKRVHVSSSGWSRPALGETAALAQSGGDLDVLKIAGLVVDADLRRGNPACELAGLDHRLHERFDERAIGQ